MKKMTLIMLVCTAFIFNGCATLLTGTSDDISFASNPSGADIMVNGLKVGKTPATIKIKRPGFGEKEITELQ